MASLQPLQALNLDSSQQQSFVRYFRSLPEKPNTTIRFFNRVDYYTVHDEDALFTAKEVFKSSAVIKNMGAEPYKLPYVVLSKGNMELFIRELLLVKLYRVEVYVNQGGPKSNDWALEYKGSPGNLGQFESILFSNADVVVTSNILAVKWKGDDRNKIVGLVCIDCNERTFSIAEFSDSEHFSELESLVVQLGPKECLLSVSDTPESKTICQIMERSNVLITKRKKSEFSLEGLIQDLNRLLTFEEGHIKDANALPEVKFNEACMALNALVKYLDLISDQNSYKKFSFKRLDSLRYVHLDSAAMNALHVLPKKEGIMVKNQSILGLLDRCRTPHGKRLLSQWVRQPLRDMNQIEERLDTVEAMMENAEVRRQLHDEHLRRLPDLQLLANKLMKEKANLQDCYKIYQGLEGIPYLVESLRRCNNKTISGAFVTPVSDILQDTQKYMEMMETTLDMDGVDRGEFLVKSSFDEVLDKFRQKMSHAEAGQKKELQKAARDLGLDAGKSIKMDYTSVLGHHFRITLKEEPVLRKNKSFRVLDAIKGGVRFTNDKLESLNEDYMEAKKSYEEHQKAIVVEVVKIAAGYAPMLWNLSELLAKLDILVSFAVVASSAPEVYVRPKMVPSGTKLSLKSVRHACLELQDGISFIPNDAEFEEGKCTLSIITGPNMGGKSTYIRSIGVSVLLAHLGSFVPCQLATIPLVDSILARVGAEDCQQRGLSTFMLEMIETAAILRTATKNSLVIIDELGRGTSTYEGCGVAWAIAECLAKEVGAFSLFATHFHEVTCLADVIPQVHNQHVMAAVQDGELVLLYQLRPGVCDRSFGIHVAKLTEFPGNIIQFAEKKQMELESHRIDVDSADVTCKESTKKEAKDIMKKFVESCKHLNVDSWNEEDARAELQRLMFTVNKSNPYIKMLMNF